MADTWTRERAILTPDRTYDFQGQAVVWGCLDGPDDAAPMVLIHGFPWSAQAWRWVAGWLARRRRVHLIWGANDDNITVAQGRELTLHADSFTTVPEAVVAQLVSQPLKFRPCHIPL